METRHVKLNYEEALSAKKHLLASEINLLKILRKIKAYRILRKREFASKSKLKLKLNDLIKRISLIQSFLPHDPIPQIKEKSKKVINKKTNIQDDLDDIKKKLEKLS